MAQTIYGRVKEICQPREGEGRNGHWTSQSFVIDVKSVNNGQETHKDVAFDVFNNKAVIYGVGTLVKVYFDMTSRKSQNGAWFTSLTTWKVEPQQEMQQPTQQQQVAQHYQPYNQPQYNNGYPIQQQTQDAPF